MFYRRFNRNNTRIMTILMTTIIISTSVKLAGHLVSFSTEGVALLSGDEGIGVGVGVDVGDVDAVGVGATDAIGVGVGVRVVIGVGVGDVICSHCATYVALPVTVVDGVGDHPVKFQPVSPVTTGALGVASP